jgi:formimidoylglutamate deiminase
VRWAAARRELAGAVGNIQDSFWTWRDLMYRFARNITPEHIEAIAAQLFSECLRHGYTSLCEFHYVQRDAGWRHVPASGRNGGAGHRRRTVDGIGMTMLPVLYSYSGFGESR